MKVRELGRFIREQRRTARLSLRKLSSMAGVSNPYLSQIERGLRRPSAEILQAIAKALRISAETLYVKAGILEERGDLDLESAILADPTIAEKQKQVLIEIYQSFKHETVQARKGRRPSRPGENGKASGGKAQSPNGSARPGAARAAKSSRKSLEVK
ncbi:MAG: helix-turn-helix transcriptional regulator [Acidobacteria bacterium]|nr:helix-turn-helix transcriptional regulator [Acidobacteriota bacterium]